MNVKIETEDLTTKLKTRIDGMCGCRFNENKKNLEPLKDILEKRWSESIDPSCIE